MTIVDQSAVMVALLYLAVLVLGGEWIRSKGWAPAEVTRSVIHFLVGIGVVIAPVYFSTPTPLYVLAALFVVADANEGAT